jgi:hypothetical protein
MDPYDSRPVTLDPGLTLLALRGLRHRDRHYPFIERHVRWRHSPAVTPAFRDRLSTWFPTVRSLLAPRPTTG